MDIQRAMGRKYKAITGLTPIAQKLIIGLQRETRILTLVKKEPEPTETTATKKVVTATMAMAQLTIQNNI